MRLEIKKKKLFVIQQWKITGRKFKLGRVRVGWNSQRSCGPLEAQDGAPGTVKGVPALRWHRGILRLLPTQTTLGSVTLPSPGLVQVPAANNSPNYDIFSFCLGGNDSLGPGHFPPSRSCTSRNSQAPPAWNSDPGSAREEIFAAFLQERGPSPTIKS